MKFSQTAEGLLDRALDDHQNMRDLKKISLRDLATKTLTRTGFLVSTTETVIPRDPSSIPVGVIRA